jgi:hypothetical protein
MNPDPGGHLITDSILPGHFCGHKKIYSQTGKSNYSIIKSEKILIIFLEFLRIFVKIIG